MRTKEEVMRILNDCYDDLGDIDLEAIGTSEERDTETELRDEVIDGINHLIWVVSRGYPD